MSGGGTIKWLLEAFREELEVVDSPMPEFLARINATLNDQRAMQAWGEYADELMEAVMDLPRSSDKERDK